MNSLFSNIDGIPVLTVRPDSLLILKDEEALRTFSRYWKVIKNEIPAKYLIAKSMEIDYDPEDNEDILWKHHDFAMKEYWEIFYNEDYKDVFKFLETKKFPERNLLSLKRDLAWKILEKCRFCEWKCQINRKISNKGICKLDQRAYISSAFIHMGEEAELVPSFTIFFSHCNFKCVFCQNWDISQIHSGKYYPPERIADMIKEEWQLKHIRNVNWVGGDPTPNLHYILDVLNASYANVPQVWNSNFYNSFEALKLLVGVIDIWLPDFKYGNNQCALRLSKVSRYFDVITRNFKLIDRPSEEILIRHLVLPNHLECCTEIILKWIAKNIKNAKVRVNVMEQYHPEYQAYKYPDISRRLKKEEWLKAIKLARSLGLSLTL